MTRFLPYLLLVLALSAAPAAAQEDELKRLRAENARLQQSLQQAEQDLKRALARAQSLQQDVTRERAVSNKLRQQVTRTQDELIERERNADLRLRRLQDEREALQKEMTVRERDHKLRLARLESESARLGEALRERAREAAWQRKLAANPKRFVAVAFKETPVRAALAQLTEQTGVRHEASAEALAGAKTKVVTLEREPVRLEEVWKAIETQTGLRASLEAGVVTFHGLITTRTGLRYEDLVLGQGEAPQEGQVLVVHYRGTFLDGKEFDSSLGKDPIEVTLGARQVIPGFEEGLASMRVGGKRRIVLPPELAYGEKGVGPIPPNATLVFEVELVKLKGGAKEDDSK